MAFYILPLITSNGRQVEAAVSRWQLSIPPQQQAWIGHLVMSEGFYKHDSLIWDSAIKHELDPNLWKAVVMVESAGKENSRSRVGAVGLSQLMPRTAEAMGIHKDDHYNPAANLRAGAGYLSLLLKRYNGRTDLALAAYNAGPGAVRRHQGIPAFKETQKFVNAVFLLKHWIEDNPETWAMTAPAGVAVAEDAGVPIKLLKFQAATL
ncbi:MAG: lytic transglycosylase domain-containing protein [Elusimicrobia bacterium]|nr:lytic transglycosylase domain-containing protein [Elusimicrobiota bacterium]